MTTSALPARSKFVRRCGCWCNKIIVGIGVVRLILNATVARSLFLLIAVVGSIRAILRSVSFVGVRQYLIGLTGKGLTLLRECPCSRRCGDSTDMTTDANGHRSSVPTMEHTGRRSTTLVPVDEIVDISCVHVYIQ